MTAVLFALFAYVSWGTGDILGTKATRKLGGYSFSFWMLLLRVVIGALYIPFAISDLQGLTLPILAVNIILGLLLIVGVVAFFTGLEIGNAAIVGTVSSSFAAVTIPLSILFLGERIDVYQVSAIIIIFIGLFLSSINISELKKRDIKIDKGILLGLVAMISWGIYFAFIKIPIHAIGWFWPSYISFSLFPLLYLFMRFKRMPLRPFTYKNAVISLLLYVLITTGGDYAVNYAVSKSLAAIVAPIAGAYPTLYVPLAYFIFKDKITKQQVVGIVISLIGIILLSFLSV